MCQPTDALMVITILTYVAVGAIISIWYVTKIDEIFSDSHGKCLRVATLGRYGTTMIFGWVALLPYELITKFKHWKKEVR